MGIRPVVGTPLAGCCTVLSVIGIIFLVSLGAAFNAGVEVLTGTTKLEGDPHTIARNCYFAAAIYGLFVAFCGMQIGLNNRHARGAVRI